MNRITSFKFDKMSRHFKMSELFVTPINIKELSFTHYSVFRKRIVCTYSSKPVLSPPASVNESWNPENMRSSLKTLKFQPIEYKLENFQRSNQDTCITHKPAVFEGDWVQSGDILTDCASSVGGELALGQNLLIAYMPWEGYNFEDAILISERLVVDDLYTSVHIERYEMEIQQTNLGTEEITRDIPDASEKEIEKLDSFGIVKVGSWVEEGDILVGKITPINKNSISPYQKLLYTILEKQVRPFRDSSLRAPKGVRAKVIDIKYFYKVNKFFNKTILKKTKKSSLSQTKEDFRSKSSSISSTGVQAPLSSNKSFTLKKISEGNTLKGAFSETNQIVGNLIRKNKLVNFLYPNPYTKQASGLKGKTKSFKICVWTKSQVQGDKNSLIKLDKNSKNPLTNKKFEHQTLSFGLGGAKVSEMNKPAKLIKIKRMENQLVQSSSNTSQLRREKLQNIEKIHIYLAETRKIQVGDKMSGRHGNKGIVSQILPIQDMPYLPDGTPIDMVLNPLGVPSRMNVGQIYECLLGLAGKFLGENYKISCFDEIYGPEASRSFVFNKLYEARKSTGFNWLFDPNTPGKMRIYDGRTGSYFDQAVTVGRAYILRLVHMVDDKIHMRSTGPYSLVTQQPLRGRSKEGGQRLGEMEVWALEGYGAAFTLLEMLTIKSDDMTGRMTLWSNLILNKEISIGTPESFKVLICELQALCLDIGLFRYNTNSTLIDNNNNTQLTEIDSLINLP